MPDRTPVKAAEAEFYDETKGFRAHFKKRNMSDVKADVGFMQQHSHSVLRRCTEPAGVFPQPAIGGSDVQP